MEPLTFSTAVTIGFGTMCLGWLGFLPIWIIAKLTLW